MKVKYYVGQGILLTFLLLVLYISGIAAGISLLLSLIIYGTILYIIVFIYKKLLRKEMSDFSTFCMKFFGSVGLSFAIIATILGGFCYYQNEISPAQMPAYELSNGEKNITFQAMSHIGTQKFYSQVQTIIADKKEQGYVLFFEGVKPGSKENTKKFDQIMGIQFDEELYKNFSKLYGVVHQNNDDFLGLVNDKDYNVDINIDTIIEIYETRYPGKDYDGKKILNPSKEITSILSEIGEKELQVLVYVNQAILNSIIKYDGLRNGLMSISGNTNIFDVILNDRNTFLVGEIAESEHENIIVTYGLMHFEGVLEELQKGDPNWEIISQSYLYPIK